MFDLFCSVMAGIVGLLSKNGGSIEELLMNMLNIIKHRGNKKYIKIDSDGNSGVGVCYSHEIGVVDSEFGFDVDRCFVVDVENEELLEYFKKSNNFSKGLKDIIRESKIGFSAGGFDGNKMILARDVVGLKPLYLGENENYFAFSSEKKVLWSIDIYNNITPVQPGELVKFNTKKLEVHNFRGNLMGDLKEINFERVMEQIKSLLTEAVLTKISGDRSALLFSGGLDSCIIAQILKNKNIDLQLYCAGFPNCRDINNAETAAKIMGLPLKVIELSDDLVNKYLEKIVYHLESTDTVTAEIATPFYFASKCAQDDGFYDMFTGQGADELFGGYSRYEKIVMTRGYPGLRNAIHQDLLNIWSKNLTRDDKICIANGVELSVPYLNRRIVEFGLTIPPEFKVKQNGSGFIRKYILREVGKMFGLTNELTDQQKTAVQYGSGSSKCFHRLANVLMDELGLNIEQVRSLGFNSKNELLMNVMGLNAGLAEIEIKNVEKIRGILN